MPLTKIGIICTVHLGDNNYVKMIQKGNIAEGETKEELTDQACVYFNKFMQERYPAFNPILPEISVKVNESYLGHPYEASVTYNLESEINSCTSIKTLESYKFIVKGKPELEQVYRIKLRELNHD